MGEMIAAALSLLLVGGVGDVRLDVGVRAESRAAMLAPSGLDPVTRTTLDLMPRAGLLYDGPPVHVRAAYAPRLRAPASAPARDVTTSHQVDLRAETDTGGLWEIGAGVSAVRGYTDPLSDLWLLVPSQSPSPTPTTEPQPFESLRTAIFVTNRFGRRTSATGNAAWSVSGGSDAPSRALLPIQRTVALGAALDRNATRRDTLRLSLDATATRTDPASDAAWGSASVAWRHDFTRAVQGMASAGGALTYEDAPQRIVRRSLTAVAEGGLSRRDPNGRGAQELAVRVKPAIDRLTGEVSEQLEATATVHRELAQRWWVSSSASGGAHWTPGRSVFGLLDGRVSWAVAHGLAAQLGFLARWQREESGDRPSFFEGATFVALAFDRPHPARRSPGRGAAEMDP